MNGGVPAGCHGVCQSRHSLPALAMAPTSTATAAAAAALLLLLLPTAAVEATKGGAAAAAGGSRRQEAGGRPDLTGARKMLGPEALGFTAADGEAAPPDTSALDAATDPVDGCWTGGSSKALQALAGKGRSWWKRGRPRAVRDANVGPPSDCLCGGSPKRQATMVERDGGELWHLPVFAPVPGWWHNPRGRAFNVVRMKRADCKGGKRFFESS